MSIPAPFDDWDRIYAVHRIRVAADELIPPPGQWSGPYYRTRHEAMPEMDTLKRDGNAWAVLEWRPVRRRWVVAGEHPDEREECPT